MIFLISFWSSPPPPLLSLPHNCLMKSWIRANWRLMKQRWYNLTRFLCIFFANFCFLMPLPLPSYRSLSKQVSSDSYLNVIRSTNDVDEFFFSITSPPSFLYHLERDAPGNVFVWKWLKWRFSQTFLPSVNLSFPLFAWCLAPSGFPLLLRVGMHRTKSATEQKIHRILFYFPWITAKKFVKSSPLSWYLSREQFVRVKKIVN